MPPPPDEKCDPACQKIIINTGLMAIALELLLAMSGVPPKMMSAALTLRRALAAHLGAYDTLTKAGAIGLTKDRHSFKGCDQASEIMTWAQMLYRAESLMPVADAAVATMAEWTSEQMAYAAALILGRAESNSEPLDT